MATIAPAGEARGDEAARRAGRQAAAAEARAARGNARPAATPPRAALPSTRCSRGTRSGSTPRGPRRSPGAASRGGARRARTSPTSCDEGTFVEYGPLIVRRAGAAPAEGRADRAHARRRAGRRRSGRSTGSRPCVASYDYTVLAGTQGMRNHLKKDRLFELAERRRLPVVLFAEGGGGRPGRRRLADRRRARLPRVPPLRPALRPRAARRASPPASASPATRRCSAAATW